MRFLFPSRPPLAGVLAGLTLAAQGLSAGGLTVGELNYNDPEGGDYDFIELVNTGSTSVPLSGLNFSRGVGYTFTTPDPLAPGQRVVVVRDRTKFIARYGSGFRIAEGTFSGGFSADGERVTLTDSGGVPVLDFTYGTSGDWPSRPAGLGSTLEPVDPDGDLNDPDNWRPSSEWLGSPGRPGAGPQRTVAINEILAHTDPPFEDAIELLNLTDGSIRLDGWYVSNERSDPRKYRIPNNTVLAPRGRIVLYEYQFSPANPPAGQKAFRFNSAHGDEAVLMSADSTGRPLLWVDVVSFGATANGIPLGRYPEGTGPLTTLRQQTFGTSIAATFPSEFLTEFRWGLGAPNSDPLVGPVVFRRIQYSPAPGGDEFLELQSNQPLAVPLYDPAYPDNTWRIRGATDFDFPKGLQLPPNGRILVVGIDPALFRSRNGIPDTTPVVGPWTNSLGDLSGRVVLFKPDPPQLPPHPDAGFVPYVEVEEIRYSAAAPWPEQAAGTGAALLRKDVSTFGDDPSNWTTDTVLPPTPPEVTAVLEGNRVLLKFLSEAGRTYRLESRELLPSASWTSLGLIPVPTAGGPVAIEPPTVASARLLRVTVD